MKLSIKDIPGVVINIPRGIGLFALGIMTFMFDNDGTIHRIREKWKGIMEEFMMGVLTKDGEIADESLVSRMRVRVRELIYETDGINTIEQMVGLVKMIQDFNQSDDAGIEVRDTEAYKLEYVRAMQLAAIPTWVGLLDGSIAPEDVIVEGSFGFLHRLKELGAHTFIVSGTDLPLVQDDLNHIALAMRLHWETLVDAIYGALLDSERSSKEARLREFLAQSDADPRTIAVIGDGPVELAVGYMNGCFTIGIAADEERREFLTKKVREITGDPKAEICMFIPDFGSNEDMIEALVEYLMGEVA